MIFPDIIIRTCIRSVRFVVIVVIVIIIGYGDGVFGQEIPTERAQD